MYFIGMKRSFNNIAERQRHRNLPDVWWVAINGEVRDDNYTLAEVRKHFAGMPVAILNAEESNQENPDWTMVGWESEQAAQAGGAASVDLSSITERMDALHAEISVMHKALGEVVSFLNEMNMVQEAKDSIQDRLDQLEARERAIEKTEHVLIERLNQLEEDQTAMDQRTDDAAEAEVKKNVVNFG